MEFNPKQSQGRKYRDWPEVQAYFQLQNFEVDIPGLECRPENARRDLTENVTLEENTKKESPGSISAGTAKTAGKRKKRVNSVPADLGGEDKKEEDQPKPKRRGRKKKTEVDEDYVPEVESKKTPAKTKKSPVQKKTPADTKQAAVVKEPTLDETPDVSEAKDQIPEPDVKVGESVVSVVSVEPMETVAAPPGVSSNLGEAPSPSTLQAPVRTPSQVPASNPSQAVSSPSIHQSKVKVETPKSAPSQVKQQPAASQVTSQGKPQTPSQISSKVRPQTPNQMSSQVRPQTPRLVGPSQIRQRAPGQARPQTPVQTNTKARPQTPGQINSPVRAPTPTPRPVGPSQVRQGAPRPMTPGEVRGARATPPPVRAQSQLSSPAVRAVRPVRAVRSPAPPQRAATPVRTPGSKAGGATAGPRQQSPAVRPGQVSSQTKPQVNLNQSLTSSGKPPSKAQRKSCICICPQLPETFLNFLQSPCGQTEHSISISISGISIRKSLLLLKLQSGFEINSL